ncbi:MAG: iron-containing alcohol dehydrogenase [Nitrospiria bacterium]
MANSKIETLQGDWHFPTTIHFGVGRIGELPHVCKRLKIRHPLLVTDAGLVQQDFMTEILKVNETAGLVTEIFSEVKPNPTGANIEAGVADYQQGGCDGVIAIGGGSSLDAGKAMALMIGQERSIWDFEDKGENWRRVNPAGIASCIAIPTTAGTGSEVGRASVIVDTACQCKRVIFHPKMLPNVVIADPALTVGLPAHITAATGLDAFVHNLEAYCALGYHPMAEGVALEGMRLIKLWLPVAFEQPEHLGARSHMLAAASMGAVAFQKGLGAVHALAHPLGARFDLHHGLLNAILLPYVLRRNCSAIEQRLMQLGLYLGLKNPSFDAVFTWILALRRRLQIPETLQEIGISSDQKECIGQLAYKDPSAAGNPIPFSAQDYTAIFDDAVHGNLS